MADRDTKPLELRKLSHEQAAREISKAGQRHAATPELARAFLERAGILDKKTGKLAKAYR